MRRLQTDIVLRAIREAGGDRKLAAQRLKISLSGLYSKLNELREAPADTDAAANGAASRIRD
jgi:two-component system response regulator AtoC